MAAEEFSVKWEFPRGEKQRREPSIAPGWGPSPSLGAPGHAAPCVRAQAPLSSQTETGPLFGRGHGDSGPLPGSSRTTAPAPQRQKTLTPQAQGRTRARPPRPLCLMLLPPLAPSLHLPQLRLSSWRPRISGQAPKPGTRAPSSPCCRPPRLPEPSLLPNLALHGGQPPPPCSRKPGGLTQAGA